STHCLENGGRFTLLILLLTFHLESFFICAIYIYSFNFTEIVTYETRKSAARKIIAHLKY
ncbi:MAG TPA: hypothetical protein VK186_19180, partial [Candidatus Deferrimicrobium sp.]|nr:hypothetical protein [Candidatus Deferrimicrobium sp.]